MTAKASLLTQKKNSTMVRKTRSTRQIFEARTWSATAAPALRNLPGINQQLALEFGKQREIIKTRKTELLEVPWNYLVGCFWNEKRFNSSHKTSRKNINRNPTPAWTHRLRLKQSLQNVSIRAGVLQSDLFWNSWKSWKKCWKSAFLEEQHVSHTVINNKK